MANGLGDKLVLAISSRALFDLSDSHKVYLAQGVEAYRKYQIEHEEETLEPGDAFPLVKKTAEPQRQPGPGPGRGGAGVAQQCRHRACACSIRSSITGWTFPAPLS
ncbi:MAG: 5'-nucleotidase [Pseudomonas veronii]|jgi:hypothetical protein|nr:5'-nucleotidase [Pseudomonas veronii]